VAGRQPGDVAGTGQVGAPALVRIWTEAAIAAKKRWLRRPRPDQLKVNLGGGRWYAERWHNVDLYAPWPYADERLDLRELQRLPYADDAVVLVFASHVLEHLRTDAVRRLLAECVRVMRRGAVLRAAVPDRDAAIAAYERGDERFFDCGEVTCHGRTIEQKLVNYFASFRRGAYAGGPDVDAAAVRRALAAGTAGDFVRWCVERIPPDADYVAHVNGFDYSALEALLREAGFPRVWRSRFRGSAVEELRQPAFDNRPTVSLFVEAAR
jgi:SAM-dependent methyltransferase